MSAKTYHHPKRLNVCFWHKADIDSSAAFTLVAYPLMPAGRDQ